MNDEIKEKIKAYYIGNDIDKVLDYITNLQQDKEIDKKFINDCAFANVQQMALKFASLQEELKSIKSNYKIQLEYDEELENYKSRNEKAIEYVNTHKPSDTISFPLMKKDEENQVKSCFDYEFREIYQKELLNILQGNKWNEVEIAYLDDKPIESDKE